MIKAIFSEVLRVGRTTALAVGVALMVALTVGLASAALAGTGVGARFPGPKSQRPAARVPASLHATKRYGQPDEREARTLKQNIPRTLLAALAPDCSYSAAADLGRAPSSRATPRRRRAPKSPSPASSLGSLGTPKESPVSPRLPTRCRAKAARGT
jgi:hypothetical protein